MNWNFSFGWFFLGLIIFVGGGLIVLYYRQVAENIAHGVSSYDKTKLAGLIAIGIGFLIMTNLHTALLTWLVHLIFPGRS